MLDKSGKPKACGAVFGYHDISIIEYYKSKALGILNYYRPAANFHEVKKLSDYHLRWSLLHTLAGKHTTKVHEIIKSYGKTPKVELESNGKFHELASFLTPNNINPYSRFYQISRRVPLSWGLDMPLVKLSIPKALFAGKCAVIDCANTDIEVHHVRSLRRTKKGYAVESIKSGKKPIKDQPWLNLLFRENRYLCVRTSQGWHRLSPKEIDSKYLRKSN